MGIIRKEDVHSSFNDYIKEVVDYDSTITSLKENAQKIIELQTNKANKVNNTILFSGSLDVSETVSEVTLLADITKFNELHFDCGQGGAKTWISTIFKRNNYPATFAIDDIITLVIVDVSYNVTCVSFKIINTTTLQVVGGSARLRNIRGVI